MTSTSASSSPWLSSTDRCDRCGARGYVVAVFDGGVLVFCAHHGRQYSTMLTTTAALVFDESDQVLVA